jgi:hypothetical protein
MYTVELNVKVRSVGYSILCVAQKRPLPSSSTRQKRKEVYYYSVQNLIQLYVLPLKTSVEQK